MNEPILLVGTRNGDIFEAALKRVYAGLKEDNKKTDIKSELIEANWTLYLSSH